MAGREDTGVVSTGGGEVVEWATLRCAPARTQVGRRGGVLGRLSTQGTCGEVSGYVRSAAVTVDQLRLLATRSGVVGALTQGRLTAL